MRQTITQLFNKIATQFNPQEIPKSQAKDINGFRQRELMKKFIKENLGETAKAFDKLLLGIQKTSQTNLLIHRTSKILLKKKTEITELWKTLRPIAIMSAIYMVFYKIIMQGLKPSLKTFNRGQQHG